MRKIELKDAPIDLIHCQVVDDSNKLSGLFKKKGIVKYPKLVLYDSKNWRKDYQDDGSLEVYPSVSDKDLNALGKIASANMLACYDKESHAVILNRSLPPYPYYEFSFVLAEEVTHSMVSTGCWSTWAIEPKYIKDLNGYLVGFGERLVSAIERFEVKDLILGIDEFYGPLGRAHLRSESYTPRLFPLEEQLDRLIKGPGDDSNLERHRKVIYQAVAHLPARAGELLVEIYQNDVTAILRDHPILIDLVTRTPLETNPGSVSPTLTKFRDRYLWPLLMYGKLL